MRAPHWRYHLHLTTEPVPVPTAEPVSLPNSCDYAAGGGIVHVGLIAPCDTGDSCTFCRLCVVTTSPVFSVRLMKAEVLSIIIVRVN